MNPAQRQGAIDLIEALGREPLALAQASSVVANSTLACRDYRDYFARRRQQIGVAAGEVPSAAAVTWTLSLGQAESLLPGASVRLMLVLVALLDGHGIPGAIFSTPSVAAYLGGAVDPVLLGGRPEAGLGRAARHRAGRPDQRQPGRRAADDLDELGAPGGDQAGGTRATSRTPRRGRPPVPCSKSGPPMSREPWAADSLRVNAASLQNSAADVLWADGCHPVLLRAGRSLDDARLVGPAVEYWRDLAARCDTKLMPGHPDALVVAAHLAAAYLAAGYAGEAVHWYQRVLAERGRELAPGHPAIIAARVSLAKALIMAGEPGGRGDRRAPGRQRMRAIPRSRSSGHPQRAGTSSPPPTRPRAMSRRPAGC